MGHLLALEEERKILHLTSANVLHVSMFVGWWNHLDYLNTLMLYSSFSKLKLLLHYFVPREYRLVRFAVHDEALISELYRRADVNDTGFTPCHDAYRINSVNDELLNFNIFSVSLNRTCNYNTL
jgi:hypothetical protein